MSTNDAQELREQESPPTLTQWDVFTQGLPSDPRGTHFRLLADPRPEEVAAAAGEVQRLQAELSHLAEVAEARHPALLAEAGQPQSEATFGPPRILETTTSGPRLSLG
jgi:hypothetical protein